MEGQREEESHELYLWLRSQKSLSPKAQKCLAEKGDSKIHLALAKLPLTEETWDIIFRLDILPVENFASNPSLGNRHIAHIAQKGDLTALDILLQSNKNLPKDIIDTIIKRLDFGDRRQAFMAMGMLREQDLDEKTAWSIAEKLGKQFGPMGGEFHMLKAKNIPQKLVTKYLRKPEMAIDNDGASWESLGWDLASNPNINQKAKNWIIENIGSGASRDILSAGEVSTETVSKIFNTYEGEELLAIFSGVHSSAWRKMTDSQARKLLELSQGAGAMYKWIPGDYLENRKHVPADVFHKAINGDYGKQAAREAAKKSQISKKQIEAILKEGEASILQGLAENPKLTKEQIIKISFITPCVIFNPNFRVDPQMSLKLLSHLAQELSVAGRMKPRFVKDAYYTIKEGRRKVRADMFEAMVENWYGSFEDLVSCILELDS